MSLHNLITISAILFGLIFGLIFLSDGWYATPDEVEFLGNSPKIRGLLFLLGGSILPVLIDVFSLGGEETRGYSTAIYAVVLAGTVIVGIIFLASISLIISYREIHNSFKNNNKIDILVESFPFCIIAVRKGITIFQKELYKEVGRLKKLSKQRDNTFALLNGIYGAMVYNSVNGYKGIDKFSSFINNYLKLFLERFLPSEGNRLKYRACIYFYDTKQRILPNNENDLFFFIGVEPNDLINSTFSKSAFSINKSFGGWVIRNSRERIKVFCYIRDEENVFENDPVNFYEKQPLGPYKSIIACAIQPIKKTHETLPRMVLCIDCSSKNIGLFSDNSEDKEYIELILTSFCTALGTAQASMDVSGDSIAEWIKNRHYGNVN